MATRSDRNERCSKPIVISVSERYAVSYQLKSLMCETQTTRIRSCVECDSLNATPILRCNIGADTVSLARVARLKVDAGHGDKRWWRGRLPLQLRAQQNIP